MKEERVNHLNRILVHLAVNTARIEATGGEAKTSPQIAAVSIPSPTNPA